MLTRIARALAIALSLVVLFTPPAQAQRGGRGGRGGGRGGAAAGATLLKPARVFTALDETTHEGWVVLVQGGRISAVGPAATVTAPADAKVIDLPGATLLPGIIEGHSHLLLHPYDEAKWNDQVLFEPLTVRVARGVVAAKTSLMAGITTERDLGTEGAMYADVGLKEAINQGIIPGPRLLVSTRAIVAKGAYGVKGAAEWDLPKGAEEAGNIMELESIVRDQIGHGADWIKLYGDYGWGPHGTRPTFTTEEIKKAVEIAASAGDYVVVHSSTTEGMKRAAEAGVTTIEHGDGGTEEVFKLMKDKGVALCPTLAATDATAQQGGWDKAGGAPEPRNVQNKRAMFQLAMKSGVAICMGGDVGVFSHGENVREMELMVAYGMPAAKAILTGTSGNAKIFHLADRGAVQQGLMADLIAVDGDPTKEISVLHKVSFVMKGGEVVKQP